MDSASTSDILDRHLKSFAEHNVDSVVADLFVGCSIVCACRAFKRSSRDQILL
jgi:hypothetical protein